LRSEFAETEIKEVGRSAKYYRGLGMRWCKLEKIFSLDRREIKLIIQLYDRKNENAKKKE